MLGDATARLWNELTYEKRRLFFRGELTWDRIREIDSRYYHRYKDVLKVNAGQVIKKSDAGWRSYFELLKLKKHGRLLPFIKKISPPGYWRDRALGRRLIVIIRSDRYYVERVGDDWGYIVLKETLIRSLDTMERCCGAVGREILK